MKKIFLPSLTGKFADWQYFQAIIKVSDLVDRNVTKEKTDYRFKTVDEVEEIYSSEINEMLQRVFDEKRLEPMKNYLVKQNDKYVNNLTIAIYGGNPEWLSLGLRNLHHDSIDNESVERISNSMGIISLNGEEVLFVLDGQHRLKGLREAVKYDVKLLDEDIAITLITHIPDTEGKQRTRRLFTTVNRYAKPVSLGESILLDEDDLSAIITRNLISEHPVISYRKTIALNKTADLKLPKDNSMLSTTICLYRIVEILIGEENKKIYPSYSGSSSNLVRVRPTDEIIEKYNKVIFEYWNLFFALFNNAEKFVKMNDKDFRKTNGDFYFLRPIGQQIIFSVIKELKKKKLDSVIENISKFPELINDKFWYYILFNPFSNNIINNQGNAKNYMLYHLGYSLTKIQIFNLEKFIIKQSGIEDYKLSSPKYALSL